MRSREQKCFDISADDDLFPCFVHIRSEALQILHHAYVHDVTYVLLLIGDDYSRIIAGIFVKFDDKLKAAWGNALNDLHHVSISFLYENPEEHFRCTEEQKEILEPILNSIKVGSASVDL